MIPFLILLRFITIAEGAQGQRKYAIDQDKYDKYKNQLCSRVPLFTSSESVKPPDWTDKLSDIEAMELGMVNIVLGFTGDTVPKLTPELKLKKTLLELISRVTKKTCRNDIVSEEFINSAKNLFLYYLSKKPTSEFESKPGDAAAGREATWKDIRSALMRCWKNIEPVDISLYCGMADRFKPNREYAPEEGEGESGPEKVAPMQELLDLQVLKNDGDLVTIDAIIDSIWWMFSTALARCYRYFYPNEHNILMSFKLFKEDFLSQFQARWITSDSKKLDDLYAIAFGANDVRAAVANVRRCAAIAYQYEGLTPRQLVRPVQFKNGSEVVFNKKTEKVWEETIGGGSGGQGGGEGDGSGESTTSSPCSQSDSEYCDYDKTDESGEPPQFPEAANTI